MKTTEVKRTADLLVRVLVAVREERLISLGIVFGIEQEIEHAKAELNENPYDYVQKIAEVMASELDKENLKTFLEIVCSE